MIVIGTKDNIALTNVIINLMGIPEQINHRAVIMRQTFLLLYIIIIINETNLLSHKICNSVDCISYYRCECL